MGKAHSGSCRCGRVRFEVSGPPLATMACHCEGCRKMTGGPYSLSALYPAEAFRSVEGETVLGGLHGEHRHHHCGHCLSWLYTILGGMETLRNVRTPTLKNADELPPFIETCAAERLAFAETGAVESFPQFPAPEELSALMDAYARWDKRPAA